MNLSFYIAKRYLFAKKSHNAINIISMISVCCIAVATLALVCVLSGYNGFSDLVASMFSAIDPDLKIKPAIGKVFDPNSDKILQIKALPSIEACSEVLEENVLIKHSERQEIAIAKGVDSVYSRLVPIDQILIDGNFILQEQEINYAVLGVGLAYSLGINASFIAPLEIYAPKRDEKVNLSNPASSFQLEYAYIGGVYAVNQPTYDEGMLIVPINLLRNLLNYQTQVSSLELKLTPIANADKTQKEIQAILGSDYQVLNRYEQQEGSFKMMKIEKWVTFLILTFILFIALFNVISALSMLMIEKQNDIKTLRNMGADNRMIRRIFIYEGCMIPVLGALVGIVLGVILCLLQDQFGFLKLGSTSGTFVSDNYPVRVVFTDILMIFSTVFVMGLLASVYAVRSLGKKWLQN